MYFQDTDSVVVTWWNQTTNTLVMRVSNDNGATFGTYIDAEYQRDYR
jgi:hypothetical protein